MVSVAPPGCIRSIHAETASGGAAWMDASWNGPD